jgi:3'-phosphoadenosine 5'-phosphosulfate sulfotransferase (PAPS reductase)/FAD synthetase
MMALHTIDDLKMRQALPLDIKVRMTQLRIREWVNEFGQDGVYVSFSGGKDSTVLLHLVRELYPSVPAVFVDTGLEYPEIREFVKTFDNVEWLKPKMNFKQVIEKYGYPFISKEVSQCVWEVKDAMSKGKDVTNYAQYSRLIGTYSDNGFMNREKYKFFLDDGAPAISHKCCMVMKKAPAHKYGKKTGRLPILATMAEESRLRTQKWLQNGCNGFDMKSPVSTPMAFWTEQDVLRYIKENGIEIASVYGDIIADPGEELEGQMDISDYGLAEDTRKLKTTGCDRTGCMFCGFGCHLEGSPSRFERMKETHPKQYEYIMKPVEKGGLGYKEIIDWINEHGNLHIKY